MGGATWQRTAGQAGEDHGGHQLVHVDFLRPYLAAGRHRRFVRRLTEAWPDLVEVVTSDLLGTLMLEDTDLWLDEGWPTLAVAKVMLMSPVS